MHNACVLQTSAQTQRVRDGLSCFCFVFALALVVEQKRTETHRLMEADRRHFGGTAISLSWPRRETSDVT